MALTPTEQAAAERLTEYNGGRYDASTNQRGLAGEGYKTQIPAALNDTGVVAEAVGRLAEEVNAAAAVVSPAVPIVTAARDQAVAAANTAAGIVQHVQPSEIAGIPPIIDFPFSGPSAVPSGVITGSSGKWVTTQAGVLVNVASGTAPIDFDPVTSVVRGLLGEESRTNPLTYSQQWDNAAWTPGSSAASVSANSTVAPDGTLTADTITDADAANQLIRQQVVSVSNDSATRCFSVFLKQGTAAKTSLFLQYFGGTSSISATVEIDWASLAATISGSATAGVIPAPGGYIRLWVAFANNSTGNTSLTCRLSPAGASATATGTVIAWHAQTETGSFPTSCIPTTSSTVTRSADVNTLLLSSVPGWLSSEFTIYIEAMRPAFGTSSAAWAVALDDGTSGNRVGMFHDEAGAKIAGFSRVGGVDQGYFAGSAITAGTVFKAAFAVKASNFAISVNGAAATTASSGSIPSATRLVIGGGDNAWNGYIRRLTIFPRRLANSTLQLLTA